MDFSGLSPTLLLRREMEVTWGWGRGDTGRWWQGDVHHSGRTTGREVEVVRRGFFFCCRRGRES